MSRAGSTHGQKCMQNFGLNVGRERTVNKTETWVGGKYCNGPQRNKLGMYEYKYKYKSIYL